MEAVIKKVVDVKIVKIDMNKTSEWPVSLHDSEGKELWHSVSGSIPYFLPGGLVNETPVLMIDFETGMILNWRKPDEIDLQSFLNSAENGEDVRNCLGIADRKNSHTANNSEVIKEQ